MGRNTPCRPENADEGEDMTKLQELLHRYIDNHFEKGTVSIQNVSPDKIRVRNCTGENMTLTMNLFCDVLDADTGQMYARSNLPHDLNRIGTRLPTAWEELPGQRKSTDSMKEAMQRSAARYPAGTARKKMER